MNDEERSFVYWKKPWQGWLVLTAAFLQLLLLRSNISDYREFSEVGKLLMTAEELTAHLDKLRFQCVLNGLTVYIFLGIFLIGTFCRSRRAARTAETLLLLVLALTAAVLGIAVFRSAGQRILSCASSAVALGGGIYGLVKLREPEGS